MINKILHKHLSKLDTIVVILKKNLDFFLIKITIEGRMDILLSKINGIKKLSFHLQDRFYVQFLPSFTFTSKLWKRMILKSRLFT